MQGLIIEKHPRKKKIIRRTQIKRKNKTRTIKKINRNVNAKI